MSQRLLGLLAPLILVGSLPGCAPDDMPGAEPSSGAALAGAALDAMGGREALEAITTLEQRGDGTRTRMGQIAATGGEDPTGQLRNLTETIDFANGRAAFDYDVINGGFMQHRTEALTTYENRKIGWGTGPGRPNIATSPNGIFSWAMQNSPEMLLRRNIVTVALAAANTAPEEAAEEQSFAGAASLHATATLPSGESIDVYFDAATGLIDGFSALDTEVMLGDVEAQYVFDDYGPVDGPIAGLVLPHSLTIRKDGRPFASIEYSSMTVNDDSALSIFEVPADATEQAEQVVASDGAWAPITWNEVADGIYHAVGYSHHSMVVEFDSFVAVIEGPYTEAQSLTLARLIETEIGKPIRYVAPTHPHYDHTGGIRALASVGAEVLVAAGHEAELRAIVESPHTNPPDALERARSAGQQVGSVEVFSGNTSIESGSRSLELYEVTTIPHVNPKVLAFVPDVGVLFQSDLFFGGPSPDATALHAAIENLGLDVQTIVGGHGGTWPYQQLVEAAAE